MPQTVEELLARVQELPEQPLTPQERGLLAEHIHSRLVTLLAGQGISREESEEVTQERVPRILRRVEAGEIENPDGYLGTVARYAARDTWRRRKVRGWSVPVEDARLPHPGTVDPIDVIDAKRRLDEVRRLLDDPSMPERYREAILRVEVCGEDRVEFARSWGVKTNTVDAWVSRGRRWLKAHMTDPPGQGSDR